MPQLDLRQHPLQRDVSKVVTYFEPHPPPSTPPPGTQDQRHHKRAGVRLKHSLDHRDWEGLHWKLRGTLHSDPVAPTPGPHSIAWRGSPPPPLLSVSPVGKREQRTFPSTSERIFRDPHSGFACLKEITWGARRAPPLWQSAGLAATSTQTRRPPYRVPDPEQRSQSRCCQSGLGTRLSGSSDWPGLQSKGPTSSFYRVASTIKQIHSLGTCASRKLEVREAWSENPGSRRANPIVLAGLRVRPVALSNCWAWSLALHSQGAWREAWAAPE